MVAHQVTRPVLILAGLLLSAFGVAQTPLHGSNLSVHVQETVEPTAIPVIETVLVPVTGDNGAANNNTTLLVYVLIGIAGMAFFVALVALLARSNQVPHDSSHTH